VQAKEIAMGHLQQALARNDKDIVELQSKYREAKVSSAPS
jgi:hypothetical protein